MGAKVKGNGIKRNGIARTLPLHLMLLPAVAVILIYNYVPMAGIVMAFQDFDIYQGVQAFWKSEWVGFDNYRSLWSSGEMTRVVLNTFRISFFKLAAGFLVPIVVAVLLNEVRTKWLKRGIQTVIYMPHFLSWVLLAGIIRQLLANDGLVNQLILQLGGEMVPFLSSNKAFVPMLVFTDIWKGFGFGTIVYLAAITGIDPALHEAAKVDGAGRWKRIWHVTLPGMRPIIVLQLILSLQNVLNAGFDQIFNLYNVQVYETADIIDTWVYRMSFQSTTPMYDMSAAVGLLKSGVSFVFISVSYWMAKKFANYEIF